LRELDVVAVVSIDSMQARGSARLVVGLRVDDEAQARVDGSRWRIAVLVADGHGW
jgi:hypothetical protein